MLNDFAETLKKLREERGMTQRQLADASGLSYGIVRHYEQATRGPTWENVVALCKALEVTCDVFTPAADVSIPRQPVQPETPSPLTSPQATKKGGTRRRGGK